MTAAAVLVAIWVPLAGMGWSQVRPHRPDRRDRRRRAAWFSRPKPARLFTHGAHARPTA